MIAARQSARTVGTIVAMFGLSSLPIPATAEAFSTDAVPTAAEAPDAFKPRVIFGRALDLEGQRQVYTARSNLGDTGGTVLMSLRPFPRMRAIPTAQIGRAALGQVRRSTRAGVSSGFGMRRHPISGGWRPHLGVDIPAPSGSPVLSPGAGTVSLAGWYGSYGLMVAVDHRDGVQTRYAHLSSLKVAPGQRVSRGDVIGYVGSTGRSTGPHLHYETRVNGQPVNPLGR